MADDLHPAIAMLGKVFSISDANGKCMTLGEDLEGVAHMAYLSESLPKDGKSIKRALWGLELVGLDRSLSGARFQFRNAWFTFLFLSIYHLTDKDNGFYVTLGSIANDDRHSHFELVPLIHDLHDVDPTIPEQHRKISDLPFYIQLSAIDPDNPLLVVPDKQHFDKNGHDHRIHARDYIDLRLKRDLQELNGLWGAWLLGRIDL